MQSLFALNGEYYFGDKGSMEASERFAAQPDQFSRRLQGVLALSMATPSELLSALQEMQILWKEVVHLTEGRYRPKFEL